MSLHTKFGRGTKKTNYNLKPNDIIYTPPEVAKKIIALYDIKGCILDGFAGEGVFYNNYPSGVDKYWCEITKGVDFFDFTKSVDWIITNPPYSIFNEVLQHSIKIANNIVYLVPLSKVVSSMGRIRMILNYGNIVSIHVIPASQCGFPFGFPACAIHIKRGYKGKTLIKEINVKAR